MKREIIFAHLALIIAGLLFGANYWVAKGLMPDYLNPRAIIVFRTAGASILFLMLLPFARFTRISKRDWIMLALCGITGVTINQYLFFVGLNLSSPIETSLLHTISPLVVVVFAWIYLKEKISWLKTAGILSGFAGALLLTLSGKRISLGSDHFLGNIFILLNITSYSLYLVLVKPLMKKYDPLMVISIIFLFGFVFFIPFSFGAFKTIDFNNFPKEIWFSLVYVVVGTTFLTYLLTIYALRPLSAGTVGFYIYLQPLISGSIGIISGQENISLSMVLSAMLIFSGVFLININKSTNRLSAHH